MPNLMNCALMNCLLLVLLFPVLCHQTVTVLMCKYRTSCSYAGDFQVPYHPKFWDLFMFIVEDLSFWPSLFSPFVSVLMLENQLWEVFLLPPLLCLSFAVAVVLMFWWHLLSLLEVGLVIISFQKCLKIYKQNKLLIMWMYLLLKMQGASLA